MKCGIIGCGRNTEDMHIPALRGVDGIEIMAVHDINSQRLDRFKNKYNIKNYFDKVDSFFDFCSDAEFIIISTPGYTHFELCKEALERKFNVLVEIPVTLNLRDANILKDIANRHKLKLGVIQNYRYRDPVMRAKRLRKRELLET